MSPAGPAGLELVLIRGSWRRDRGWRQALVGPRKETLVVRAEDGLLGLGGG